MASEFVSVDVTVSTTSIPAPPIKLSSRTKELPSFDGVPIPDIDIGGGTLETPDIDVDLGTIPVPEVSVGTRSRDLGSTPGFFLPDVSLPTLRVETFEVELFGSSFDVVDPRDSRLVGGSVGVEFNNGLALPSILIPTVDVGTQDLPLPRVQQSLPDIPIPRFAQELPDVPAFAPGPLQIPTGGRLTGSVGVVDPTGVDAAVEFDFTGLQAEVLSPLPSSFIGDPAEYVFQTVLSELESRVTVDVAERVKGVLDGFLELLLAEETKERLRDQADE